MDGFRLMLPDDANFAENVHGGTLLKLIEETGGIVVRRYVTDKVKSDQLSFGRVMIGHNVR